MKSRSGERGPYRDGDKLVITEGEKMPKRCPKCNSKEVDEPKELSIRRESKEMGGVSGMIKAGMDKASGWKYTGPVSVSVYFCQRHKNKFRNRIYFGGAIIIACAIWATVIYLQFDKAKQPQGIGMDFFAAIGGVIVGFIVVMIPAQNPALVWFKPKRFVDRTVWVQGACKAFLESLPRFEKE
jgi:hypothetical protein